MGQTVLSFICFGKEPSRVLLRDTQRKSKLFKEANCIKFCRTFICVSSLVLA